MDIATVALKLESDFPRRLEVYEIKQRVFKIKNESIPVLDLDCYLIPKTGDTCYKNFIFDSNFLLLLQYISHFIVL